MCHSFTHRMLQCATVQGWIEHRAGQRGSMQVSTTTAQLSSASAGAGTLGASSAASSSVGNLGGLP